MKKAFSGVLLMLLMAIAVDEVSNVSQSAMTVSLSSRNASLSTPSPLDYPTTPMSIGSKIT